MKKFLLLALLLITQAAFSSIHTWHDIHAKGHHWLGRLSIISAEQGGYFTDASGNNVGQNYDFQTCEMHPFKFGFGFYINNTDFNVAYTLTMYQAADNRHFESKSCVFVVSAKSPKVTEVEAIAYHGASCNFDIIDNVGLNFSVA